MQLTSTDSCFACPFAACPAAAPAPFTRPSWVERMSHARAPSGTSPANVIDCLDSSTDRTVRTSGVSVSVRWICNGKRRPLPGSSFACSPRYRL
jgi:hypothetical protein